jgi:hypothetical protein
VGSRYACRPQHPWKWDFTREARTTDPLDITTPSVSKCQQLHISKQGRWGHRVVTLLVRFHTSTWPTTHKVKGGLTQTQNPMFPTAQASPYSFRTHVHQRQLCCECTHCALSLKSAGASRHCSPFYLTPVLKIKHLNQNGRI